ncbi:hypothetical protein HMPREF0262_02362 [Clostridium sp. ATCC 29733]|nr:hypothetical protein HMPREF0262_02362 [Clostridium sp. ATCC 29733]
MAQTGAGHWAMAGQERSATIPAERHAVAMGKSGGAAGSYCAKEAAAFWQRPL